MNSSNTLVYMEAVYTKNKKSPRTRWDKNHLQHFSRVRTTRKQKLTSCGFVEKVFVMFENSMYSRFDQTHADGIPVTAAWRDVDGLTDVDGYGSICDFWNIFSLFNVKICTLSSVCFLALHHIQLTNRSYSNSPETNNNQVNHVKTLTCNRGSRAAAVSTWPLCGYSLTSSLLQPLRHQRCRRLVHRMMSDKKFCSRIIGSELR